MTTTHTYNQTSKQSPRHADGWLVHHDTAALRYMRARLYGYIEQPSTPAPEHTPPIIYLPEPDGRHHRVVLMNAPALRSSRELTFVAFFGYKRPDIDATVLDELDHELIHEFMAYPHLLSYSSLELSDGSWANLVLMSSPEGIARWAESQRHAYAAREIAPNCYRSIRLHQGSLSGSTEGMVEFRRTKLFTFTEDRARA